MKQLRKVLSLILALCMLLSMANMGITAQAAEADSEQTVAQSDVPSADAGVSQIPYGAQSISLDVAAEAVISTAGEKAYFTFTPEENGIYVFSAHSDADTLGYIYDANMSKLAEDDDGGDNLNFSISWEMTAGTTYVLGARFYSSSDTGSFNVSVVKKVVSGTLELDTPYEVTISNAYDIVYLEFVPEVTGSYTISASSNGQDTKGYLYDAQFNQLTENDDYNERDFLISYALTAGVTYYFGAGYWGTGTGTYTVTLMKTPDFQYRVQNEEAIIAGYNLETSVIEIPETLGGYPVTGITNLGYYAMRAATEIIIPDSVTMLGDYVFYGFGELPLQKLTLGSGVSQIPYGITQCAVNLQEVTVSVDNEAMVSVDGVVYSKDMTTLLLYPAAKEGTYVVPDSVTDLSFLFDNWSAYSDLDIQFGTGTDFVTEDGIIYNADKTKVIACSADRTGSYVMPDSVVEIADGAFANSDLTEVTVSPNVTEIVYCAFYNCDYLQYIHLPENLNSIEMLAFAGCWNLREITIPATLTQIGPNAFTGCGRMSWVYISDLAAWCAIDFAGCDANPLTWARSLVLNGQHIQNLQIPGSVESISDYAFYNSDMIGATIPGNVKTIGSSAFYGSALQQVTFAEGLEEIGYYAFGNTQLQSVALPNSLQMLGSCAFLECGNLKSVELGSGLQTVGSSAFAGTGLKSITLPENITSVQYNAFAGCDSLTEVVFENDAIAIGSAAFYDCPLREINLGANATIDREAFQGAAVTTVSLPANITDITYRSFAYCSDLISVVIPASVETVDPYAFEGDTNLHHVLYKGTEAQWNALAVESAELNAAAIHFNAVGNEIAIVESCTQVQHYCSVCGEWETYDKENATHNLVSGVCTDCGAVEGWYYDVYPSGVHITGYNGDDMDVTIPAKIEGKDVIGIAPYAFYWSDITSVTIPASVRTVGERAFAECFSLESVTFATGSCLQVVEYGAFAYCENLTGIKIPEGTVEICDYAFQGAGLRSAAIANTVVAIGEKAFADCYYLGNVSLGSSVEYIGFGAFSSCYSLGRITLPQSLRTLSSEAFLDCITLGSITIPSGVTELGDCVFYGCNLMESISLPAGITSIGNQMFDGCESLTAITIPATVTDIGYYAFRNTGLTDVDVPKSVASIDVDAFAYCDDLTQITFNGNAPHLNGEVFSGVTADAYYHGVNKTWTKAARDSFGGDITWKNICGNGHSYGKYVSNNDATYEKDGTKKATCKVCGYVNTVNDPGSKLQRKDGWKQESGKWVYYQNGKKLTNSWMKDTKGWCYLGADGYMITNSWMKDSTGWCYLGSDGYMVTNNWMQDSAGWCYLGSDGYMITNSWMKDSTGWCYLGANGYMTVNSWIMDATGWCYLGADGYCVTNSWMKDSTGWCYLDSEGRMATNQWLLDSTGWCYIGANGYCVTNSWMQDSTGWCYLDSEGRMATNQWLLDSQGWCYIGANGYCVTNCWMKDSIGWVFLNAEGRMVVNAWIMDSVGWCYLGENGYAVTNCWKQDSVGWCYLDSEGSMVKNAWVDGYYINADGYRA